MKLVRIRDNAHIRWEDLQDASDVVQKIADKTLEQLDREGIFIVPTLLKDAEDITREQMVLQSVNNFCRTGNVMGFLGCGTQRLTITSRFSTGDSDYLLQYLLSRVLKLPNITTLPTNADQDSQLFGLFPFLFPYYLKCAMRKGIFKAYIRKQYNDANVRGTIHIPRHIAENTPFVGRIAYDRREFSQDNSLMELVRHTIEWIQARSYGPSLLNRARDEVQAVVGATPGYALCDRGKIIAANERNVIRHAYYREYRALQRLCLMILTCQKHQLGTGAQQIHGILFDGAWLWEEYINLLVQDIFYHPMNKAGTGRQYLFAGNIGLIYPDFISRNGQKRTIADAKYKPIGSIANRDYLQVLAYMFRFDARKGFYFYPDCADTDDLTLWLNQGSTYENNVTPGGDICVIKHGLKIPKEATSYEDFVCQIRHSEAAFRKVLI